LRWAVEGNSEQLQALWRQVCHLFGLIAEKTPQVFGWMSMTGNELWRKIMSRSKHFVNLLNSFQPLHVSSSSSSSFFSSTITTVTSSSSSLNETSLYYGRIDRVIINSDGTKVLPTMLTTRPTKRVPFEVPVSFVMGPTQLNNVFQCHTLEQILSDVISLDSSVIQHRLELMQQKKLDLVLMIFSSQQIPCQPATLTGIIELLYSLQQEGTAQRYQKILPQLQNLIGQENFHKRIELFASQWNEWKLIRDSMWGINPPEGDSQCFTFEQYCQEFDFIERQILEKQKLATEEERIQNEKVIHDLGHDLLTLTRKLMFVLLSCNQYFGMDGFTYDQHGNRVGEEFLALNSPIVVDESADNPISCIFLSEIKRFGLSSN
jgi:hypothetical protein